LKLFFSLTKFVKGQYCDFCNPNLPEKNHHAKYAIDGTEKWWQSPPLSRSNKSNEVNLTIDFGQEFHVAYIYIKMANSPRPGVWILEKSVDNGKTYTPWQYFAESASDCQRLFAKTANEKIKNDDQTICTTLFSKVLPLEGGEVFAIFV
jgi:laminin alpha 3/5